MQKKSFRISRREFLLLSGAAAVGAAVPFGRTVLAGSNRKGSAQTGSAVVMAIGSEPVGLDTCNPWFLGSGLWGMLNLPYDVWWRYSRDLQILPDAAKSWSRPDATTVIFEMQPGMKFHGSGREAVADDIEWNYQRVIKPDLACAELTLFQQHIESIKATDKYKFEIKLKTPNLLLSRIPLPQLVDAKWFDTNKGPLMLKAEAGTGPWILDQWETENFISFKRNDDYWGKKPTFDEFRFQIMPEERATVAAIRAGQLNFLAISRIENFNQLKTEASVNTWSGASLEIRRLNVNHFRDPFKNPDILQALRVGLNRQQFVDTLTQGLGKVSGSLSPALARYALSDDEIKKLEPYDPDQAKSLLAKAGYDDKKNRLRLSLLSIAGFKDFNDIAQITQANLKDIGIDVEIRIQEVGVWVDSRVKLKDYDLSVNDWGTGYDPDYTFYRSDQSEQDWTGGKDPDLDKLIDASNVEQDDTKRAGYLQDIQRKLIQNVRELYLYSPPSFEAASKKITGYTPFPGGTDLRVFDRDQVTVGS